MLGFADRAMIFVHQDYTDHAPNRRIGCQKRFVELGDRLSIHRAFHGLPTSNLTSALGQADLLWAIFRRSTATAPARDINS